MEKTQRRKNTYIVLTKTGPRCISFRSKITVSIAQGAVHDAEADVADPVLCEAQFVCMIGSEALSRRRAVVHVIGHELQRNSVKRA